MNEVARKLRPSFDQIPGKVVGGAAPTDCLAGKDCAGDPRMAALSVENERLAADAAGVRNLLADEEATRGKAYTAEERAQRMAQLQTTLQSIGKSTDSLRQEGRRLIESGNVEGGTAKLDQALDADEKAIAEAERIAMQRRKAAVQGARDLAVLAKGRDAVKAMAFYRRAAALDPDDAGTWGSYGRAAMEVGRLAEAKVAFTKSIAAAHRANDAHQEYWARLGLGDVARGAGSLPEARNAYNTASAIAERPAKADPGNAGWQRDLAISHGRVGRILARQGKAEEAQAAFRERRAIIVKLRALSPDNATLPKLLAWFDEQLAAKGR